MRAERRTYKEQHTLEHTAKSAVGASSSNYPLTRCVIQTYKKALRKLECHSNRRKSHKLNYIFANS